MTVVHEEQTPLVEPAPQPAKTKKGKKSKAAPVAVVEAPTVVEPVKPKVEAKVCKLKEYLNFTVFCLVFILHF